MTKERAVPLQMGPKPADMVNIPAPTVIAVGMEVVLGGRVAKTGGIPFQFGSYAENTGVVRNLLSHEVAPGVRVDAAEVFWQDYGADVREISKLLAYSDFLTWKTKNNYDKQPKFQVDQILFVLPGGSRRASPSYPSIGSPYESDVKILQIKPSKFLSHMVYNAYVPSYGNASFNEYELCTAEDREKYFLNVKYHTITKDSLPFLHAGERVKIYDGWLYNIKESVVLKMTPEIQQLID